MITYKLQTRYEEELTDVLNNGAEAFARSANRFHEWERKAAAGKCAAWADQLQSMTERMVTKDGIATLEFNSDEGYILVNLARNVQYVTTKDFPPGFLLEMEEIEGLNFD